MKVDKCHCIDDCLKEVLIQSLKQNIAILNLEKIQSYINKKSIKTSEVLNSDLLKKLKLIDKNSNKLKILGNGEIKDKIDIEADLASKSAIEKLEKIGGSIQLKNNLNLMSASTPSNDLRNRIIFFFYCNTSSIQVWNFCTITRN